MHVRQVTGASKVENRFEARRADVASPLLGRDEELELLLRRWEQAKRGEGRVVLLTGEAGIGKSRLTRALQERLRAEPHTSLTYHCSPYHQDSALYPVIAQLTRAAGIERDDSARDEARQARSPAGPVERQSRRRYAAVRRAAVDPGRRALSAAEADAAAPEGTHAAGADRPADTARRTPAGADDIRGPALDRSDHAGAVVARGRRDQGQRVLLVATARPEFTPPWPSHRHVTTVPLTRLDRTEGEALVAGVTKGKPLPAEVLEQIVARTDGVPLFIEELTKTVLESGLLREAGDGYELTGPLPPLGHPIDAACLAARTAGPSGLGQGRGADRGRDRPGVLLRADRRGCRACRRGSCRRLWRSSSLPS